MPLPAKPIIAAAKKVIPAVKGWFHPELHPSFASEQSGKDFYSLVREAAGRSAFAEEEAARVLMPKGKPIWNKAQSAEQFAALEGGGPVTDPAAQFAQKRFAELHSGLREVFDKTGGRQGFSPNVPQANYAPKKYAKFVAEEEAINPFKARRGVSEAEAAALGGRVYAPEVIVEAINRETIALERERLYQALRDTGIVHRSSSTGVQLAPGGKIHKLNSVEIKEMLDTYGKMEKYGAEVTPEVQEAKRALNEGLEALQFIRHEIPSNYAEVPSGFGSLSGSFIPQGAYNHIVKAHNLAMEAQKTAIGRATKYFKMSKTAFSPPTWFTNAFGNPLQHDLAGFHLESQPKYIARFYSDRKAFSPAYREAVESGAISGSFHQVDLKIDPSILAMSDERTAYEHIVNTVRKVVRDSADAYGYVDNLYKGGAFSYWRDQGKTVREAARLAQEGGFDYGVADPYVHSMAKGLVPFIKFPYKSAGLIGKALNFRGNIAEHGVAEATRRFGTATAIMAAPATLSHGILSSMTDEDYEQAMTNKPQWMNTYTAVPIKREDGYDWWNPIRTTLIGPFAESAASAFEGKYYEAAGNIASLSPAGTLAAFAGQIMGRGIPTDIFTGQDIYSELDSRREKAILNTNYFMNVVLPTWMRNVIAPDRMTPVMEAITGRETKRIAGRPFEKELSGLERLGRAVPPLRTFHRSEQEAAVETTGGILAARKSLRKQLLKAKSEEDKDAAVRRFKDRIGQLVQRR